LSVHRQNERGASSSVLCDVSLPEAE
jgi:hypothetical protein